jgi:hypothetical protein
MEFFYYLYANNFVLMASADLSAVAMTDGSRLLVLHRDPSVTARLARLP